MSGFRGNPNGFVQAPTGTMLTEESGKKWCKGYSAISDNLGWFEVGTATGHPAVYVLDFYQTNPNGLLESAGPAVAIGVDQSIWVKTVPTVDDQSWKLLGFQASLGQPDFYVFGGGELS